jgi:hypothetical protein
MHATPSPKAPWTLGRKVFLAIGIACVLVAVVLIVLEYV